MCLYSKWSTSNKEALLDICLQPLVPPCLPFNMSDLSPTCPFLTPSSIRFTWLSNCLVLYLLDSILKNIGAPYTVLFSLFITPLFLESYKLIHISTQNKMQDMLITWHTALPLWMERSHASFASIEMNIILMTLEKDSSTSMHPTAAISYTTSLTQLVLINKLE